MTPAAHLHVPAHRPPSQISIPAAVAGDADVPELAAAGTTEVVVEGGVQLAADTRSLLFIRFLRETMSAGIGVVWSAQSLSGADVDLLTHLPPPTDWTAKAAERAARWKAEHRYGSCYYRRGPGFISVKDTRRDTDGMRFLLADEPAVTAFGQLLEVADLNTTGPAVRELTDSLAPERLVLRYSAAATVLPIRMRRWPIPFDAI